MDRYMNDTHSLYYNVDHSSMFGSNLSTVFADGPPPLEDNDDDHGEFVFSSETDAIGEAVLNKIESKLQRDAEGKSVGDKSGLNLNVEMKPISSEEKFEAFANFETSNQNDNSDIQDASVCLNPEVNGHKESVKNYSDDEFSDDEFGDFSNGFSEISSFNENDKIDAEKQESKFGDFSTFNNKSVFSDRKKFNGDGEKDVETERNSDDLQFADFSSFEGVDFESSDNNRPSNDNSFVEQQLGKESNSGEMANENDDASDDEFSSFTERNKGDFGKFETNGNNGLNNLNNPNPDVIPAKEQNESKNAGLPLDLTNHGTNHDNDQFNAFESFNNDIPSDPSNDLTSAKLPPDLTNHETNSSGDFNSFEAFNDDDFNDFTSSSDNGFPSNEHPTNTKSDCHECQASNADIAKPGTNLEKCKTEGDIAESAGDDDFGDFADFSNASFNAENQSDAAFGSFPEQNEESSANWSDAKFEAFEENSKTDKSKVLSKNSSGFSTQDSEEFSAFSESTSSKTGPEFQADFGAFSESNISKKQEQFQANFGAFSESTPSKDKSSDFGAFSEITPSKDKQSDFGAFSGNTISKNKSGFTADFGAFSQKTVSQKSFDQTLSNKQYTPTKLVSLHGCFQDVFVTLQHRVDVLQNVKVPGKKRMNQEDLWKNLHASMDEGTLRFGWEQCKISDKMCKALEVSKKNIMVNSSALAMSEGLEIPVFATGLGILQPSIVPTPPKKKKVKRKQSKEATYESSSSASSTPPPNLSPQTRFSEVMTENIKDNSDAASLSNSDTASLDLDFFASAPSNLQVNTVDQSSTSSLYNLDFAFGSAPPANQAALMNTQPDLDVFKTTKPVQDDPLEILKKLDTSKMSSSVVNEGRTQLSARAKEIIESFDDLSFMHSSVLMFPLHKNN